VLRGGAAGGSAGAAVRPFAGALVAAVAAGGRDFRAREASAGAGGRAIFFDKGMIGK
jgi:hypothetical protein